MKREPAFVFVGILQQLQASELDAVLMGHHENERMGQDVSDDQYGDDTQHDQDSEPSSSFRHDGTAPPEAANDRSAAAAALSDSKVSRTWIAFGVPLLGDERTVELPPDTARLDDQHYALDLLPW